MKVYRGKREFNSHLNECMHFVIFLYCIIHYFWTFSIPAMKRGHGTIIMSQCYASPLVCPLVEKWVITVSSLLPSAVYKVCQSCHRSIEGWAVGSTKVLLLSMTHTMVLFCRKKHLLSSLHIQRCHKYTNILIENIFCNQFTLINTMYRFECILLLCCQSRDEMLSCWGRQRMMMSSSALISI